MKNEVMNEPNFMQKPIGRLNFLKYSGAALATTTLIMVGCKDKKNDPTPTSPSDVSLGSGDVGILNYAYALEQLEAAFYIQVMATPYTGMTDEETLVLTDLKNHEIAHRNFFKAAIGSSAIIDLTVDFSTIDFTSRTSVLGTAKAFEDLGVSAYNGAGKLIVSADYLLLAGKIVSVEARHASAIRDLLNPLSVDFAGDDVVTTDKGLDGALMPADVLATAGKYVKNKIDFSQLPTA